MRTATVALLVGGAVAFAVACHPQPSTRSEDKRAEIIALWTQIRGWRQEAGMALDPQPQTVFEMKRQTVQGAERVCPDGHEVPQTCNDVCNLADAICDNAERICDIAAELGPDDQLGQSKCESAKASCREAKKNCCGCSDKAKAAATW